MLSGAQHRDGAPAQWYQRKQSNDQSIAVFERLRLGRSAKTGSTCRGSVHQFHAERIEPVTGYEMMPFEPRWSLKLDAFGDGQEPRPVASRADQSERSTKGTEVTGGRSFAAGLAT